MQIGSIVFTESESVIVIIGMLVLFAVPVTLLGCVSPFAIRLALSRVLSQRAGGRLQMLVIDEGFGSQDAEGRQRLIEVINLVRTDFARILVITHLEQLKDAFPARIEVEKTADGFKVKVGSVAHPMEEKHYIEWIEIIDGTKICRQHLNPGQPPEAVFQPQNVGVKAREYCNIHGLWQS